MGLERRGSSAGRLESVFRHTTAALTEMRLTGATGKLSDDLAMIHRFRLGPVERSFMLAVAVKSAEPEEVLALIRFLTELTQE